MQAISKEKKMARQFRLPESIDRKINEMASQTGKSRTMIVEEALLNFFEKDRLDDLADKIIDKFDQKYGNTFTRIRLGVNSSDINSQIQMELMNSFFQFNGFKKDLYTSTKVMENEVVKEAKQDIRDRIAKMKQAKDQKNRA